MTRAAFMVVLSLPLAACQAIGDAADHLGGYMPVIGERCAHWQCFTEEGQAISNANKTQKEAEQAKQQEIDDALEQGGAPEKTSGEKAGGKTAEPAPDADKRPEKP